MFYATRINAFGGVSEQQVLKFYTRAHRAAYLAKDATAAAITAKAVAKFQPAGWSYTIRDKEMDAVYFGAIVARVVA